MRMPGKTGTFIASAVLAGAVAVPLAVPSAVAAPAAGFAVAGTRAVAGIPFTAAEAHRAADGGYTLNWSSPASQVTVTASTDPEALTGLAVGSGNGSGSLTVPAGTLATAERWYFRLTPDAGASLVVAERSLGLAGADNFRDAGGYRTTDGHWVRTGAVYRSNKLSDLTAAEQQVLVSQHITLDIDLRNVSERHDDPDRLPAGVTYQVADVVSLSHGLKFHENAAGTLAAALAAGLFSGSSDLGQSIGYPFMVNFVGSDYAFHDALTGIANNPGATVFHCTAGKDRTGWTNAVLLTLLGVPRSTVEADFLASNTYTGESDAVELSWLNSAFAEVNHLYGNFDNYLHQGLKLDDATIAALRAKLLV